MYLKYFVLAYKVYESVHLIGYTNFVNQLASPAMQEIGKRNII